MEKGEQHIMKIVGIFDEVAQQMRSELEKARKAIKHPGLKGSSLEEAFRSFLRDYLPRSLDVSTGILIDASGNDSRQLDVIISDSAKTPIFYRSGGMRVIPVECAYTVIEVKAYLDADQLNSIFQNMKSVRNLKKTAYLNPPVLLFIQSIYTEGNGKSGLSTTMCLHTIRST